jgi:sugar/nucleoside kinase (ribokinase family)
VQAAMKEASMASAISVTRNGASTSIPERKEVLESLCVYPTKTRHF